MRVALARVDGTNADIWVADPRRGEPNRLTFQTTPPTLRTNDINVDVTADGQRFLLVEPAERTGSQPLTVTSDWVIAARGTSR